MVLILDACTVSNLINVFQNDVLLKSLPSAFSKVYIASEVIQEVKSTKDDYKIYYSGRWDEFETLYNQLNLNDYLPSEDAAKLECKKSLVSFLNYQKTVIKQNGEFYSSLLSLYMSRLGDTNFGEYIGKILFATDDARAEQAYQNFFDCNRIGSVVSSIDIVVILYLKGVITKAEVLSFIEGLYPLYSRELNRFKNELKKCLAKEKDPSIRLGLSTLDEYLSNGEFEELFESTNLPSFRKTFKKYYQLKVNISSIPPKEFREKMKLLKLKHDEFKNDLVWKV